MLVRGWIDPDRLSTVACEPEEGAAPDDSACAVNAAPRRRAPLEVAFDVATLVFLAVLVYLRSCCSSCSVRNTSVATSKVTSRGARRLGAALTERRIVRSRSFLGLTGHRGEAIVLIYRRASMPTRA